MLEDLSAAHRDAFGVDLTERLKAGRAASYHLFCAFTALTKGLVTPKVGPRLDGAFARALRAAEEPVLRRVLEIVDGIGPDWRARWLEFAASRSEKPGMLGRFKRRG